MSGSSFGGCADKQGDLGVFAFRESLFVWPFFVACCLYANKNIESDIPEKQEKFLDKMNVLRKEGIDSQITRRGKMITRRITLALMFLVLFSSCVSREDTASTLVIPANSLMNQQTQNQISVAVEPYSYSGKGLNYNEAGIYPFLVTLTNESANPVVINPETIFAQAYNGQQYLSYRPHEAIELVINSQAINTAAKGATAGAAVGTLAGGVVGLTLGAIIGVDVGEAARVGAKTGFAAGGAGGGGAAVAKLKAVVREEINNNALRRSVVQPGMTKTGWLFFPALIPFNEIQVHVSAGGNAVPESFVFSVSRYFQ